MTSPGNVIYREDVVPLCLRLVQTAAELLTNGVDKLLSWQQVDVDTHDIFDPLTPTLVTPPAGLYQLTGTVFVVASSAITQFVATPMVGGAVYPPRVRAKPAATSTAASLQVSAMISLNGSTSVGLYGTQTSGGNLNTSVGGTFASILELTRLRTDY